MLNIVWLVEVKLTIAHFIAVAEVYSILIAAFQLLFKDHDSAV